MVKIIIAEDDPYLRTAMARGLRRSGDYAVIECYDGANALEAYEREGADIVVTDIMMSRLDGYALTKHIKKANANIPILMITALESSDAEAKGYASGADEFLVKPIPIKHLGDRVRVLYNKYNSPT